MVLIMLHKFALIFHKKNVNDLRILIAAKPQILLVSSKPLNTEQINWLEATNSS